MEHPIFLDGLCNMPGPQGTPRVYCHGQSVFETRELCTANGETFLVIFRYCLNHLRAKISIGLVKGDAG
jgi:hypothetical protein